MIYACTPCWRTENLEQIAKSIPDSWGWVICSQKEVPEKYNDPSKNWYVLKVPESGEPAGYKARNFIIENGPFEDGDWLWQLDDDTIVHPDLEDALKDIHMYDEFSLVVFNQCFHNFDRRSSPTIPPQIGSYDIAMYVANYKFVKPIRYHGTYCMDQLYVFDCWYNGLMRNYRPLNSPPFAYIDRDLSFYNWIDKEDWNDPKYKEYAESVKQQKLREEANK